MTQQINRTFIAWDGEGENIKGEHRLILLANSVNQSVVDKQKTGKLSWQNWLPFLCSQLGTNVWFSFGYDVNMIFKDLDEIDATNLFQKQERITLTIGDDEYKVKYIPKKILIITHNKHSYTHYDVFGFFQTSFEKSLTDWNIPIPPIITEGKLKRTHFQDVPIEFIVDYNAAECTVLVELMSKLSDCIQRASIPHLRSWHGAGAISSTFLNAWNFLNHKTTIKPVPDTQELFNARKMAYFGGRSELFYRGKINDVLYRYDINSAYPNACQYLPSLHNKEWYHTSPKHLKKDDFALVKVKWNFPFDTRVGAMPFRKKDNMIIFCRRGEGWYHNIEVQTALRKGYNVKILDSYVLERPYEYFLLDKIQDIAEHRLQLKKQKDLGHIPLKLGLNAIYGKLAQRPIKMGDHVKHGTYTELFHSGFITAYTRSQLMEYLDPKSVIMLATDGIFSRTPLNVPVGEGLGEFEASTFDDGIFMLSGLYATKENKKWSIKTRGYSNMTWDKFNKVFQKQVNQESVTSQENRFISIKLALRAPNAYRKCEFQNIERNINWNNNPKRIFKFIDRETSDSLTVDHPIDQPISKMYDMVSPVEQLLNPELQAMTDSYDPKEI